MCRNKLHGGRQCPSHTEPQLVAQRNARRRELYKLKTTEATLSKSSVSISNLAELNAQAQEIYGFQSDGELRQSPLSHKEIVKESEEEVENFTDEQDYAIQKFTSSHYRWINGALFGKATLQKEKTFKELDLFSRTGTVQEFETIVKGLDSAFASTPLKERLVYRGKDDSSLRFTETHETVDSYIEQNYALGSEVIFDGYQSTSISPSRAVKFSSSNGIMFEMKTRSGINVSSLSAHKNEHEVLLPRSSRWKIVGVKKLAVYEAESTKTGFDDFVYNEEIKNVTIVQMIEVDDDGQEITVRRTPPPLTDELLDKAVIK